MFGGNGITEFVVVVAGSVGSVVAGSEVKVIVVVVGIGAVVVETIGS